MRYPPSNRAVQELAMPTPHLVLSILVVMLGLAGAGPAHAAATADPEPSAPAKDARLVEAEKAVKAKNYAKAVGLLERVVADTPRNADALNYLGYSHRKLGNREQALTFYTRALAIDPNHRGANEYLGELYLDMNDLPKAEERLAVLLRACGPRCEEYRDLRAQIEKFKAGKPRS
jgi:Tfp pilus assembly protein PilF